VILIGGSWGGTLIANYMAAYPGQVARAILTSPSAINYAEWKQPIDTMIDRLSSERRHEWNSAFGRPRLLAWLGLARISPRAATNFVSDAAVGPLLRFHVWDLVVCSRV